MSYERRRKFLDLALAGSYPHLSPTARWVFLILLDHESDTSWDKCFPSQTTICRLSGASKKVVMKALWELGERAMLYSKRRGGMMRHTCYRTALPGDDLSDLGDFLPAHQLRRRPKTLGPALRKARVLKVSQMAEGGESL